MAGDSKGSCSSSYQEGKKVVVPKTEVLDYDFPQFTTFTRDVGDNVASSSGSKLRSFFVGMGFMPSLVDKVIEENGEDNADLLLEALIKYSDLQKCNSDSSDSLDGSLNARRGRGTAPNFCVDGHSKKALQKSNSQSSDSLDSLFDDKRSPEISTFVQPKEEELDELEEVYDDKRASLVAMNFSVKEVEFAISKLGEYAPVHELVDFIVAAQIAEKIEKETEDTVCEIVKNESTNEKLFGTMEKTLQLLGMGFSENEVSSAIERLGAEAPIAELAYCIVAKQNGIDYVPEYKLPTASSLGNLKTMAVKDEPQGHSLDVGIKTESFSLGESSQSRDFNLEESYRGKRVKEEGADEFPDAVTDVKPFNLVEAREGKRPKPEYFDDSSSSPDLFWVEEQVDAGFNLPNFYKSNPSRGLTEVVAKPPYFFFAILSNISYDSWGKISQFLYAVEPEFVNTQVFSAISRNEGYVHNLPAENRFHVLPKPPMTIEDAIPHTKKWWPSWDTRKQLSCINCETNGVAQHCDRLARVIADSGGVLTPEKQNDILRYCRALNLIWIGKHKLGPVEAEHLELVLGYPLNHTRAADIILTERLRLLKYCFQTDTLGYHLSVLKPMFPGGLTVLSIFSGIGGAEVALHRLGVKMKAVVSVETSETNRKILKRWWQSTRQTGELVQIEGIERLTSSKLDNLTKKFGSFDLVICQNPCTYSSTGIQTGNFDFRLFYEFVRVLQRVRSFCERK